MKYKIKIEYIYTDTVEVEANSVDEAKSKALDECDEQFSHLYDLTVQGISNDIHNKR
tara:strand:- start:19 stop:189 length:171 start_codon:yes stop_codon:yes gene_type:complete